MIPNYIRVKTLFLVERNGGEIFVSEDYDSVKRETYYRPIGGTVEFGENTIAALKREIFEETGKGIIIEKLFHVSENIFTYNGQKGHEIVFIYKGKFEDDEIINLNEYWITESNGERIKCLWIDKKLFKEKKLVLVPDDLSKEI